MGFEKQLADGSAGVEIHFADAELVASEPDSAQLQDTQRGVIGARSVSPFLLDLGPCMICA